MVPWTTRQLPVLLLPIPFWVRLHLPVPVCGNFSFYHVPRSASAGIVNVVDPSDSQVTLDRNSRAHPRGEDGDRDRGHGDGVGGGGGGGHMGRGSIGMGMGDMGVGSMGMGMGSMGTEVQLPNTDRAWGFLALISPKRLSGANPRVNDDFDSNTTTAHALCLAPTNAAASHPAKATAPISLLTACMILPLYSASPCTGINH